MLTSNHYQEWLNSAVHPDLIRLNVRSITGLNVYDYLFYSEKIDRLNTGRISSYWLKKYAPLENGGWWCGSLDPNDNWDEMLWGCFKPDAPRLNADGNKPIKYEHPPKTETRAFFLRVPLSVWERIARRNNLDLPANIQISEDGEALGFWQWVIAEKLPIVFTEGAKKAASLLSAGYVAIALPGINGGYRTPKDANGNRLVQKRHLIPELDLITGGGREIYISFDQDERQKTVKAVREAIATFGELLFKAECQVKITSWSQCLGKGVDDLIFNHGVEAFEQAYSQASPLHRWRRKQASALTYPVSLRVNQRYLGSLPIPDCAKLICLKAPKGTGKTETIVDIVARAIAEGQPVLVLTHRIPLGEALCQRFGIPYITQVGESEVGKLLGFGLCVDSLHPNSQAHFNAENWDDAIVILDEAEQVIWHMVSANTEVKKNRCNVLRQFRELISSTITGGGRVILSDADLSDISIDYIRELAGVDVTPWIAVNDWKPEQGWTVYNYNDPTPAGLVLELEDHITGGGRPLIVTSGQKVKSKFGTRNLEARLKLLFPHLRILRIDSETIADPDHPACGCVAHLNQVLGLYDIVIASPSIETGVSIDIQGHFDSCWVIAQGNLPENTVRQQAARLREGVNRYVWAASFGGKLIGNGSTVPNVLMASQHNLLKQHLRTLGNADINFEEIDQNFCPSSQRVWGRMAARVNAGKIKYREAIAEGLREEGHTIINVVTPPDLTKGISEELKELRDYEHRAEAIAESEAELVTHSQYEELSKKKAKTKTERLQERKYSRHLKYGGVDVTRELILKDDDGWHPQIQLHYYCTVGREYLEARDAKKLDDQLNAGAMALWKPDFNHSQLGLKVRVVEVLNLLNLLDPEREYRKTDTDLIAFATQCKQFAKNIKDIIGITIRETDTPIAILQNLLGKVGLCLTYSKREGSGSNRVRVYKYIPPQDGREQIFQAWIARDTSTPRNIDLPTEEMDVAA